MMLDLPDAARDGYSGYGGSNAAKQISKELCSRMTPFVKPGKTLSHELGAAFKLFRGSSWCSSSGLSSHSSAFSTRDKKKQPSCFANDLIWLCAEWTHEALDRIDVDAWVHLPEDASCSREVLEETADRVGREEQYDKARASCKSLPKSIMAEITSSCRVYSAAHAMRLGAAPHPKIRVICNIEAAAGDTIGRKGHIHIELFARRRSDTDWPGEGFFCKANDWPRCQSLKLVSRPKHGSGGIKGLLQLLETGEAPEAQQPQGLTVPLRPYQRQSLKFMQDAEACEGGFGSHIWAKVKYASTTFWWSPIIKRATLQDPTCNSCGGFLAEEMGLGKTVICLGIILSRPAPPQLLPAPIVDKRIKSRATLVICAVSLVGQWAAEAEDKLGGSLRICQYHGSHRPRSERKIAEEFDLVITTYQTLGSDYRQDTTGDGSGFKPLGAIDWHRIILDEGHMIKTPQVLQSKAVTALRGKIRWVCTGTPINNGVDDLLGQFTALHLAPYSMPGFFNPFIKSHYHGSHQYSYHADTPLLYLLSCIMVRHTKQQVLGGEAVLALPPKSVETVPVYFTSMERQLYMQCYTPAKQVFEQIRSWGGNAVSKRLLAINALLLPVRRICSGQECTICLEPLLDRPVRTPCQHWFCRECILEALASAQSCPNCRAPLPQVSLVEGVPAAEGCDAADADSSCQLPSNIKATSESKLLVLLSELKKMRETDGAAKALVFSQYRSTIEWLKVRLTQEGFGYRFITGSMPLKKRAQAIADFGRDPPTTIFLLTMRSGAVGINLTAANHVFLLEPALNPALEEQAIGRAWRMGQKRPVIVKRLFVKGSIEENIMELTKQKIGGAAGDDEAVDPVAARSRKIQAANLAGSLKSDKPNLKLEELGLLFKKPSLQLQPGLPCAATC
ncbi:hypothetical protein WJX84_004737 [Apatococcus fuscideae]|uniref:Uncharacterized protein n=1 Tax=Apatococcus fuscideae TaxID=2026836 RepID=A0AAW1SKK9_9CHLO